MPSRGPQAWHHLPLANTSSACGEPAPAKPQAGALIPALPRDKTSVCETAEDSGSDCGVHVPNPAESKGARSSGGLPGGGGVVGNGLSVLPVEAPAHVAEATGGKAVGVYPRLHSHQPRCSWRPATPDGPAPPAELQTAASRRLRPGAASLHHPGGPPGPRRGPSVGAWFSGSQGACVSRGGTRPSRGSEEGF